MSFKEIGIKEIIMNPFTKIGREWSLLTAGTKETGFNMMTASWAGFGMFWNKNTVTVYIRKSRYTSKFFNENDYFTVSFYEEGYREALNICGKLHGNECDKVKESGLTPYFLKNTTAFEQASLIFVCRKLLHADVTADGSSASEVFDAIYGGTDDYHRIFIGEVVKVLVKE
ncbi:MAG: flavin reductase family protein [Christensenellales bacterium]